MRSPYGAKEHVDIVNDVVPDRAGRERAFWRSSNDLTSSVSDLKTNGPGADCQGSDSGRRNAAPYLESIRIRPKKESWLCAACEAELLSDARAGNHLAFGELCRRYHNYVKWRAFVFVRNHEDAEDLAQDVFLRAYQHLQEFRGTSSFKTWITQIAKNSALMLLRKRKVRPESNLKVAEKGLDIFIWEMPDPALNPEQTYLRTQMSQILKKAVRNLPPTFRLLMERCHANELELQEAAQALGITKSAAKSRLFRARALLRLRLSNAVSGHGRVVPTSIRERAASENSSPLRQVPSGPGARMRRT